MKKIRYLSLIELTAFYDALGVELKRNRVERVRGRGTVCGIPSAATFMSSFGRRCFQGCVSSFSHLLLLLFLREWSFRSPSHRTSGEWPKEGSWNKSAPYLPKSEYHLACLVTRICFSTICIDTQRSHRSEKFQTGRCLDTIWLNIVVWKLRDEEKKLLLLWLFIFGGDPFLIFVIMWYHAGNFRKKMSFCFPFLLK